MMKTRRESGFTIIELLIATVVFSIVLLTISAAIIQIGRIYFKGITAAQTQSVARSVMNDITQAIELTPGDITATQNPDHTAQTALDNTAAGSHAICIATIHYSYKLGQQLGSKQHALIANEMPAGCTGVKAQDINATASPVPTGSELLGEHMRLSRFDVIPEANNIYKVTVRVVYGDDDLLCSPSGSSPGANCSSTQQISSADLTNTDLRCKDIRSGTQFCAVSELSTMVERRLK